MNTKRRKKEPRSKAVAGEQGLAAVRAKSQLERTRQGVDAVVDACEFDLGVLVSVVKLAGGGWQVETAVTGIGPATVGAAIGTQLRQAADELERRMTESSATILRGLS